MGKHIEATGSSYGKAPADAWVGIREAGFESISGSPSGNGTANSREEHGTLNRRGLFTLQDLMPRRSIRAVVGGPITFESCWRAARRHERSKSAPELISAAVAYANLGMYARDPGVAKAHLARALHLAGKAEGESGRDALNAIRASALGNLARIETPTENAGRSAACKIAAGSTDNARSPRQGVRPPAFNPAVVGGRKYSMRTMPSGPDAPAA